MKTFTVSFLLISLFAASSALDNGLGRTPPMAWLTWQRYRCDTDCVNHPTSCIGENLIKVTADLMAADGYRDAGYQYVIVDDCWMAMARDGQGRLQPDPQRFPSGMKNLSDYVHSKGLKMGIYGDYGTHTCGGYPGSLDYLQTDAQTFADWGIDYLKLDGCYSDPKTMDDGYPQMTKYLNQTGRPIMFSCSWPAYQVSYRTPNYTWIAENCNLWRNFDDISDSWDSVKSIIKWYGDQQDVLIPAAGPGHFNDPDMLVVGNYGLSETESKAQMAIWAIFAAPLVMSVDLRTIQPWQKEIILNKNVLAINQDPLGIQGRRVIENGDLSIWIKPMMNNQFAVALLNQGQDGGPLPFNMTLAAMMLPQFPKYNLVDGFSGVPIGTFHPNDYFATNIDLSGVYLFVAQGQVGPKETENDLNGFSKLTKAKKLHVPQGQDPRSSKKLTAL